MDILKMLWLRAILFFAGLGLYLYLAVQYAAWLEKHGW